MVWHVEGQNTPITVCAGKRGEKGFLRVSVVEKAQSKPKHQNPLLFSFSLSSETPNNVLFFQQFLYKQFMKVSKGNDKLKKTTTTAVTPPLN